MVLNLMTRPSGRLSFHVINLSSNGSFGKSLKAENDDSSLAIIVGAVPSCKASTTTCDGPLGFASSGVRRLSLESMITCMPFLPAEVSSDV